MWEAGVPIDKNGGVPLWAVRVAEDTNMPVVIRRRLLRVLNVCCEDTRKAYLSLVDLGLKREAWEFLGGYDGWSDVEK